jgi:hypothetical protein
MQERHFVTILALLRLPRELCSANGLVDRLDRSANSLCFNTASPPSGQYQVFPSSNSHFFTSCS